MKFVCCSDCYEKLEAKGENIVKVWVQLCGACVDHGIICFKYEHDTLALLERERYIVSTDFDEGIKIKVLGYYYKVSEKDIPYFCIDFDKHHTATKSEHPEMPT